MRFLLKMGFWIALIAFFLPSFGGEDTEREGVNYFGAFVGAQAALSDMGGFCERAPAACEAGRDVGSYVAARVGDGLAFGYAAIHGRAFPGDETRVAGTPPAASTAPSTAAPAGPSPYTPPRRTASPQAAPSSPAADPMQTAAIAAERVRRTVAADAPFAMPVRQGTSESAAAPRPQGSIPVQAALPARPAVPTPAPRS